MRDVLGWRRKFGVLGPSTNTIVQPDFEMMRPAGVTNLVGEDDIVVQTRQIFRKFATVLENVGGSLANIVETTDYVLSLEDYQKTAEVRREVFKGPPWPAATGVVVSGLVRKDALIEIKAIAVLS